MRMVRTPEVGDPVLWFGSQLELVGSDQRGEHRLAVVEDRETRVRREDARTILAALRDTRTEVSEERHHALKDEAQAAVARVGVRIDLLQWSEAEGAWVRQQPHEED